MNETIATIKILIARLQKRDGVATGEFERASESDIFGFEERTGIQLPNELRTWLQEVNGVVVGPGGLFGLRPDEEYLNAEAIVRHWKRYNWAGKGWFPLAGDGCGNHYVMLTRYLGDASPVGFVDTGCDPSKVYYVVGSNLWCFLGFLLRRELGKVGWPFQKEFVEKQDPAISRFEDLCLPWNAE
jgi:cell wall assembly regulator SMI1